ncbi:MULTISPECIES: helix-turn-helix domain-containing protein [Bacteroidales]|uniref:Helix-turn-helix domain-containing protein n=1 Tax=Parabacteroides merdae TaxID=46503 RepID=A0AA43W6A0_9BACT|nr:helix-turn-helix domain-containing protein [Parabacteroides merdae]MTT23227.1 helix-turn-helix domain-containing protein [Parabacteroides merdae]MTU51464.1 helix-turn-helix domain-containing protein [Parabacteroides merdae]MTU62955.1 helix-turn-helix domain-containing protein [Parabacteroides merdae]MTU64272.1 helix-turn-helix domain-containing protein [Parabacteroides merdae]MTU70817.1 helix-turn-helix domain-containing protein [Parabacteroides merdae]
MNKLITKEDEDILSFFRTLDHMVERLGSLSRSYRPMLNGERFLSDRELSERLKISRRTLQEYRNEGKLPYIQLGGKVLYKESDIERMLQNGYKETWQTEQMA